MISSSVRKQPWQWPSGLSITHTRMHGVTIGSPGWRVDKSSRFIVNRLRGLIMKLKVYEYKNCDTCRKALKFLAANGVEFTAVPIRETPPNVAELKQMLKSYDGDLRKLFNTSGQDYKALNMKDKLPGMSTDEAIKLLSGNGNLVKRPFVLTGKGGLVGFKEEEWQQLVG